MRTKYINFTFDSWYRIKSLPLYHLNECDGQIVWMKNHHYTKYTFESTFTKFHVCKMNDEFNAQKKNEKTQKDKDNENLM